MIPFNKPAIIGEELKMMEQAINQDQLSGNNKFTKNCVQLLKNLTNCKEALLTPSCTAALEMCALLIDVKDGDEIIMPSYTFVSTANAFALRGAHIRYVDIEAATMNISVSEIERAITNKTKAIVVVHYAGVACDMDEIMALAATHDLWVIEDAAQALQSSYKVRPLGSIGHLATLSFHDTKNYQCGEGGALLVNDPSLLERAHIIQEKGTNRTAFREGKIDKYTWRDLGSSYLLNELSAAFLSVQLKHADKIYSNRMKAWELYDKGLTELEKKGRIEKPSIPDANTHNAHLFFIKTRDKREREKLMDHLQENGVQAASHYVPLHNSVAGKKFGIFIGRDNYTTTESERLIRLPLFYQIREKDVTYVIHQIYSFFK
ncbi:dTDP-4-amino-4,6-dideoxygalactose transaminase [Pseudogracilibacillus sp. SO30301A]|uniref:dTDP-4-amino-4,6-dideoxygalactose transaminase n=1 Tax=Pseudogracilibacillus sp. SO30301A TaxID=3098291 RepID=UPI00300DFC09